MKFHYSLRALRKPSMNYLLFLSLTVATACMLSMGPTLQYYSVFLLHSDFASIYDSAYKNGVAQFPSLREWSIRAFSSHYIVMAMSITYFAFQSDKPRKLLGLLTLYAFAAWALYDVVLFVFGFVSLDSLAVSLLANVPGSLILAVAILCIVMLTDFFVSYMSVPIKRRAVFASAVVSLLGGFSMLVSYYVADFFYRPLPLEMQMSLAPDGVDLFPAPSKSDTRIFPEALDLRSNIDITSMSLRSESNLVTAWRKGDSKESFGMSIELFDGCGSAEKLPNNPHPLFFSNVSSVKVWFDSVSQLEMRGTSQSPITAQLPSSDQVTLTVEKDEKNDYSITTGELHDKEFAAVISNKDDKFEWVIISTEIQREIDFGRKNFRTLNVAVDDKILSIPVVGFYAPDDTFSCRSLSFTRRDDSLQVPRVGFLVSTRVLIKPANNARKLEQAPLRRSTSSLLIKSYNTFLDLTGTDSLSVRYGSVRAIRFSGNKADINADRRHVGVEPKDNFFAFGDFGAVLQEGELSVEGPAKELYYNGIRMNSTKWEQSDGGATVLWGLVGSALFSPLFLFQNKMRYNRSIAWLGTAPRRSRNRRANAGRV